MGDAVVANSNLHPFQRESGDAARGAKIAVVAYRFTTSITVLQLMAGGVADVANWRPVAKIMHHLGYPDYFTRILGVWKVLGAMTLLLSDSPRLREWAYAGTLFDLTGATASHISRRDPPTRLIGPLTSTTFALTSWALQDLRNPPRKPGTVS